MTELESDHWIGKILGNCEIQKWLGEGAMAGVYEAYHQSLKCQVAIKIMHPDCLNGEQGESYKQRFLREARCASSLHHPNILKVIGVEEDHGVYYLVMELIKGKSLLEVIQKNGPIPLPQALNILKQTTLALKEAHGSGVIHRDIKPGNIMLLDNGQVKLMDFGLAFSTEERCDISQAGEIIGTIFYMSPEQATGQKKVDHRCDFYALGITFFQMLTSELPYQGRTPVQVIEQHVTAPIPDISRYISVPREVSQLLEKLLAKKANQRFDNAVELLTAISHCEKILQHPKATAISTSLQHTNTQRHQPTLLTKNSRDRILIIIILLLLVLLIWVGFKIRRPLQNHHANTTSNHQPILPNQDSPSDMNQTDPRHSQPNSNNSNTTPATPNIADNTAATFLDIIPANHSKVTQENLKVTGKISGSVLGVQIGSMPGISKRVSENLYSFSGQITLKIGINVISIEAILVDGTTIQTELWVERIDENDPISSTTNTNPAITRIEIIPSKIQICPGQVVHLQAYAYTVYDQKQDFQPYWIVSGGTMSANGDYIAGQEPGNFVIIVRDKNTRNWLQGEAVVQIVKEQIGWFGEPLPPKMQRANVWGDYVYLPDNSIMVYVPEGTFWQNVPKATTQNETIWRQHDLPGFYIDKYELTWKQYLAFCSITSRPTPTSPEFGTEPNHPVVNISWDDANAYAVWADKRLPTTYEWEKAATGGHKIPDWNFEQTPIPLIMNPYPKRIYPWGDQQPFQDGVFYCNFAPIEENWEDRNKDGFLATAPVGSFPKGISPYRVYDMAGNVWEWCAQDKTSHTNKPNYYIVHGGSWYNHKDACRITHYDEQSNQGFTFVGVRFAK